MIYGTSAEDGVFVLREVEKRALPDHEWKAKDRRARGQLSMFEDAEHSPGPYGSLRSRHLEDLTALVTELARQSKDAPRRYTTDRPELRPRRPASSHRTHPSGRALRHPLPCEKRK